MITFFEKMKRMALAKIHQKQKQTEYTDLAPIDQISNGDEYLNALDWAIKKIKNKRVKNIALAGHMVRGKAVLLKLI